MNHHAISGQFYAAIRGALRIEPGHGEVAAIAAATGLSRRTLERWRDGEVQVRLSQLAQLGTALGWTITITITNDGRAAVTIGDDNE